MRLNHEPITIELCKLQLLRSTPVRSNPYLYTMKHTRKLSSAKTRRTLEPFYHMMETPDTILGSEILGDILEKL